MASANSSPTAADASGGRRSRRPLLIAVAAVAVVAVGGIAYTLGASGGAADTASIEATTTTIVQLEGCAEGVDATTARTTIVELPVMHLNLADGHFLRLGLALELCPGVKVAATAGDESASSGEDGGEGYGDASGDSHSIEFHTAPVKDVVLSSLSGGSMTVLATAEGRERARDLLRERIGATAPEQVHDLFFVDFVMQ